MSESAGVIQEIKLNLPLLFERLAIPYRRRFSSDIHVSYLIKRKE